MGSLHAGQSTAADEVEHDRHVAQDISHVAGDLQPPREHGLHGIELALKEYLHGLGFPYEGSTEAYGKLFFESIRWLKGGNPARRGMEPDRLKLAKSGWRLFHVYQQNPYPEAVRIARQMKRQRSRARNEDATYDY